MRSLTESHLSDSRICHLWGCVVGGLDTIKSYDLSKSPKWDAVWEADRPLTHTGRSDSTGRRNEFSREISHTAPRITASPGVCERPIGLQHGLSLLNHNLWGRFVRPICEAMALFLAQTDHMRISGRPSAWEAEISEICLSDWEAEVGVRSVRQICKALWGRAPLIGSRRYLSKSEEDVLTDRPHRSASHLGLPIW